MNNLTISHQAAAAINQDLFNRFIQFIDAKPKTIETYTRAIRQFLKYIHSRGISSPTRADILAYKEHLRVSVKPTTIQNYLAALKQFFKWLQQEGLHPNVTDNIKGAKIEKEHKRDALNIQQVKNILQKIDTSSLQGKRDYALIALMITGGLRTVELIRANIEDKRPLENDQVLYIQGKGKDERAKYIKLPAQVEQALMAYLEARGPAEPNEPIFISTSNNNRGERLTTRSISSIVKQRMQAAGYDSDRLTAHSLRHTAGTLNLLNGGTLEETQQLLRHSNINTTMIYLHHIERSKNQSEQRIAAAIF